MQLGYGSASWSLSNDYRRVDSPHQPFSEHSGHVDELRPFYSGKCLDTWVIRNLTVYTLLKLYTHLLRLFLRYRSFSHYSTFVSVLQVRVGTKTSLPTEILFEHESSNFVATEQ